FLGTHLSERKRRLFACACCRMVRSLLEERCWNAILVAERYADGVATRAELDDVTQAVNEVYADEPDRVRGRAVRAVIRCAIATPKDVWQLDLAWADAALALELAPDGVVRNDLSDSLEYDMLLDDDWSDPSDLLRGAADGSGTVMAAVLRDI